MRQGEDKHHCTGEGEKLREREGGGSGVCVWWGGDQLSTSSAPGRGAERDRPSRRDSFIHVHRDEVISGQVNV